MKRVLSQQLPNKNNAIELSKEESHHLITVLRTKQNELIEVLDGAGSSVIAKAEVYLNSVVLHFHDKGKNISTSNFPLHIFAAVLKSHSMELIIEKSVELGVQSFTPIIASHSVPKLDKKGGDFFMSRWQKIADQSLKQCGRLHKMQVNHPVRLSDAFNLKTMDHASLFVCDEALKPTDSCLSQVLFKSIPKITKACIFVGPEGGWSQDERDFFTDKSNSFNLTSVHLGSLILRAETAVIYVSSIFNAYFSNR